jgi:hypothetical protein
MRNKVVVNAIIKTAVMFTVLCALIFGYFATSFGWFAKNESVNGSGISVSVEGIGVEITQISSAGGVVDNDSLSVAFSNLCPGDTVTVSVEITCYKELESLSVSLCAPQGCETPVQSEGKNYYFGSEILISSVYYNNSPLTIDAVGKSLLSTSPGAVWGTTDIIVPQDIELYTFSPMEIGTHIFTIEFTFYNASYNQNVLKNFGVNEGGLCYREFKFVEN